MKAEWIAADWGTSNLRVWAMAGAKVLAEATSDKGMGKLTPEGFEPALLELVNGWLEGETPVVVCGMAGARQGWAEAAYRAVPCPPLGMPMVRPPVRDLRLKVVILPGLSQTTPSPDVMRGEETQIAGVLHAHPQFDGVICLPGTHSKWASISAGEVTDFRSFMTGELFDLLSRQSVLRHGMGEGTDMDAFDAGLSDTLSRPESLAARLFGIRAEGLTLGLAPDVARGRLSGLLIGAELAAAKPWWLGRAVLIVGAGGVAPLYERALTQVGAAPRMLAGTDAVLAGLTAARKLLEGT